MIYRCPQHAIQAYFDHYAINQSGLKVLLTQGIDAFMAKREELAMQEKYFEEKEHFIIGGAVDCEITQGEEAFKQQYYISTLEKKPSATLMAIIRMVYDMVSQRANISQELSTFRNEIWHAMNEFKFYDNNRKATAEEDTRIDSRVLKDPINHAYFRDLFKSKGKIILAEEQQSIIIACLMALKTHRFTSFLFKEEKGIDIIYQLPIYFECLGVDCKALLDKVIINHHDKTVIPGDLKTHGDYVVRFNKAIRVRRYDLQGAFYHKALITEGLKKISGLIGIDVTGYEVTNFMFIVVSTLKPGTPLIFVCDDSIMEEGRIGRTTDTESISLRSLLAGFEFGGYEQALELYKEWQELDFSVEKKYEETNGVVILNNNYKANL